MWQQIWSRTTDAPTTKGRLHYEFWYQVRSDSSVADAMLWDGEHLWEACEIASLVPDGYVVREVWNCTNLDDPHLVRTVRIDL